MLLRARRFNVPASDALANVQREMENLFGRVLNDESGHENPSGGWIAPVTLWEDNDSVFLDIEVPGVAKESIEVTVHNGVLRITGERNRPTEDRNYRINERVYGTFHRTVNLPEDIDTDRIDARLCEGVLQMVLSKRPEAQPKRITVRD